MEELDCVDEFYFSVLFDYEEPLFPISDKMYAEELQLQEALYSAATVSEYNEFKRVKRECSGTFCSICTNNKLANEMFAAGDCSHSFCVNCVTKYVTRKIVQENVSVIKCPDIACKAIVKPKFWREIVPKQDCSALLVDDGSEDVIDSECPNCGRLFCARCNVSWHEGLECKDFQRLGRLEGRCDADGNC
ncbi:E3 ubiquitin-protein ligase RSL1-like [Solanum lycopersicum]|uniref:E3 ubiquitin-protein ligase RSL1-like n=1 Tax=Solanum lycopersicum TaxID=4081 RepID=UPI000E1CC593|nr:E3 ubiquitin-protein ligase arih1-like [Solanum lycopersicum]